MTWSFDHGVSWFSWLLSDHVKPEPDSDTRNPNEGFAITLIHGSGVRNPSLSKVTYSRPSSATRPKPLKNCRGFCGKWTSERLPTRFARWGGAIDATLYSDLAICSANVPRRLRSTARATV